METRLDDNKKIESNYIVHKGIKAQQGHQILHDVIEEGIRRVDRLHESLTLFGPHPVLIDKRDKLAEIDTLLVKHKVWLIRESQVAGMLTIDFAKYNYKSEMTEYGSYRVCLTKRGWKIIPNAKSKTPSETDFIPVNQEMNQYQLASLIYFLHKKHFYFETMFKPIKFYNNNLRIQSCL